MLIAAIQNGQILEIGDYRNFHGLSNPPLKEEMEAMGYVECNMYLPHDPMTQKLASCDPYYQDGWVYLVMVESKTQEDIDADKNLAMSMIRSRRNQLLTNSDKTQLADRVNDQAAWAAYREVLRQLPETIEDPRTFQDWPINPIGSW
jgi:hypothetical protein